MTNNQKSKIEQQVMGSVAVIYSARALTSFQALVWYALGFSVASIVFLVSIPNVLANFISVAKGGVPSTLVFIESAVTQTTFIVQLGLLLAIFALGSLLVRVVRAAPGRTRFA